MKAKKKPVIVEVFPTQSASTQEILDFCEGKAWVNEFERCIFIDTLEGRMMVSKNDYIIKGVRGEFYPCKPDIFEATYEIVE